MIIEENFKNIDDSLDPDLKMKPTLALIESINIANRGCKDLTKQYVNEMRKNPTNKVLINKIVNERAKLIFILVDLHDSCNVLNK